MGCITSRAKTTESDIYTLNVNIIRHYLGKRSIEIRKSLVFALELFYKTSTLPPRALEIESLLCPFLLLCHEILGKSWDSFIENYSLLMMLTFHSCYVTLRFLNVIDNVLQEEKTHLFHPSFIQEEAITLKREYKELEDVAKLLIDNPYFTQESVINICVPPQEKEINWLYEKYKLYVETLSKTYLDSNGNLRINSHYLMRHLYSQVSDIPSTIDYKYIDKLTELIEPIIIR